MKKILLLISVLMISSGCCEVKPEGYQYEFKNDSAWDGSAYLSLAVGYPLPEHRTKDFLATMLLILVNPELSDNAVFNIEYRQNNGNSFNLGFGNTLKATVSTNQSFSPDITSPKDINYYSNIVTYDQSISGEGDIMQIHFRQNIDTKTLSFMIMTKSSGDLDYIYLGNALLNKMTTHRSYSVGKSPLPDILK